MPYYEYECESCGKRIEIFHKISELDLKRCCDKCNGLLKRIISKTSFVLKGTGWSQDNYAEPKVKNGTPKE